MERIVVFNINDVQFGLIPKNVISFSPRGKNDITIVTITENKQVEYVTINDVTVEQFSTELNNYYADADDRATDILQEMADKRISLVISSYELQGRTHPMRRGEITRDVYEAYGLEYKGE